MPNKFSSGWDGINIKIVKDNIQIFKDPLTDVFNVSFSTGTFPEDFKLAIVKPLHKKGDKHSMNNYRPVSLLPVFSKILEKVMHKRLIDFLNNNKVINKCQFGFTRNMSTTLAFNNFLQHILEHLNSKMLSLGIFCDFSKAFDCVNHDILLKKLEHYGIRGLALKWFESYLSNRRQVVEIQHMNSDGIKLQFRSDEANIWCGVPQGSILGPTLFLIYINDLIDNVPKANFTLFADDTSIIVFDNDLNELQKKADFVISCLYEWIYSNNLYLNIDKTNIILFRTNYISRKECSLITSVGIISQVESTKFLGIFIDDLLNWKTHINYITPKLSNAVYAIYVISNSLGINVGKMVYFSYFHSIMSYGIEFWGQSTLKDNIFILQKKAIRSLMKLDGRVSCRPYFKILGILTLTSLYILKVSKYVFNNQSQISRNADIHNYNTRCGSLLRIPYAPLGVNRSYPLHSGIKIFNHIPANIRSLPSLKRFNTVLKQWLIEQSFYDINEFFLASHSYITTT